MIAFLALLFFSALTAVYVLFLLRIRQGLRWLERDGGERDEEHDDDGDEQPAVSVVVAMRNEAANAARCVASLGAQDWPAALLQVVIVDDGSTDDTRAIAGAAAAGDARFLVMGNDGAPGKKGAITAAMARATGALILTTDADCRHDPGWVRAMAGRFASETDIVAGPVVYDDRSTLFARLQALEFLGLVGVGAGFVGIGWPRLCNGANLAYRRAAFERAGGYAGNERIASGDDEFLMHAIVYRGGGRAAFATAPAAVVRTDPASTPADFLAQRRRWASKTVHHGDGRFVAFLTLLFAYFIVEVLAPWAVAPSSAGLAVYAGLFLAGFAAEAAVLFATARLFRQPVRIADLALAAVLHPPYIILSTLLGVLGNTTWKNRKLTH